MKAVELFAGAGGLGMGISQAGFHPAEIIEWDRWCCDTINRNRENGVAPVAAWPKPIHGDVKQHSFESWHGQVDLVSGGPPCQPFSVGGKHMAFEDSRDLWPHAVRAIREIRPKAFIFENVKGLTRSTFATYLSYIDLQLHHPAVTRRDSECWRDHLIRLQQHHLSGGKIEPEYKVIFQVLNAADYGVAQKRERVVFVGFRSDLNVRWAFPKASYSLDRLLWDIYRTGDYWERHKVARKDRFIDLRLARRALKLREPPAGESWRTVRDVICDLPDPAYPHTSTLNHKLQQGARSYSGHTGSPLDLPAKTLKAGVHGVPGGENMLLNPDGTVRYFTVRESARLQAFPDSYALEGSWSEAMRQLGNAVPVELARVVAAGVASELRKVP
mgnify:CR=1 FL=1